MLVTVSYSDYEKKSVPLLLPYDSSSELSGSKMLLCCGKTLELSYVAGIRRILHSSIVVPLRLDGRCLLDMLVSSGNGVNDFRLNFWQDVLSFVAGHTSRWLSLLHVLDALQMQ